MHPPPHTRADELFAICFDKNRRGIGKSQSKWAAACKWCGDNYEECSNNKSFDSAQTNTRTHAHNAKLARPQKAPLLIITLTRGEARPESRAQPVVLRRAPARGNTWEDGLAATSRLREVPAPRFICLHGSSCFFVVVVGVDAGILLRQTTAALHDWLGWQPQQREVPHHSRWSQLSRGGRYTSTVCTRRGFLLVS